VDAYNVLHVTGILSPDHAGPDLEGLAGLIAQSRWGRIRTSLICDGAPSGLFSPCGNVEAIFAGAGNDADSLIERILEEDSAPRSLRVISTDHRLRNAASRRRAGSMTSEEFVRRLNLDARRADRAKVPAASTNPPDLPMSESSVDHWLTRFGISADDPLRRLQSAAGQGASANRPQPQPQDQLLKKGTPGVGSPTENSVLPKVQRDPVIDQALEEWRDRLCPDDLDMSKWISGVIPISRRDEPPSPRS